MSKSSPCLVLYLSDRLDEKGHFFFVGGPKNALKSEQGLYALGDIEHFSSSTMKVRITKPYSGSQGASYDLLVNAL